MARRRKRRQWGSGYVFERAPDRWSIQWSENGKRRTRGGYTTREEAERVLAKVRGEIALGRAGMPPDMSGVPALDVLAKDWLERRKREKRAGAEDNSRWKKHIAPHFGHLKPSGVDTGRILEFIETKRDEGLNPATIRIFISILSSLFKNLVHKKVATANPCLGLPEDVRALIKSTHDSDDVPYIEKLADVKRIYLDLPEPLNVAYAIGAMAGLRTGEIFALRWSNVDLEARLIHVRESVRGPLKNKKARHVLMLDPLLPVLREWKLKSGGEGRVIPPLRCDGDKVDKHTPGKFLRATLKDLGLQREGLGWYEATRHTFASQWVLNGNSIEKLSKMLGHYSVVMTERYTHLRPDSFSDKDRGTFAIDLRPGGEVASLSAPEFEPLSSTTAARPAKRTATSRHHNEKTGAAL
jgi:integrase